MKCINCHNLLRSKKAKLYCSNKCQSDYQYRLYIDRWLAGHEDGMKGQTLISCHIRRWIFQQRGEMCWQCGWNVKHPDSGKSPLEIDHIDGIYTNNTPGNLRLLCPNCHALTPTYKNRNKGRGRESRRN